MGSAGFSAGASAQDQTHVPIGGTCERIVVVGRQAQCARGAKILYSHLGNGRTLITVSLADRRTVSFVGESDSQPEPTTYRLALARVRVGTPAESDVADAAGECLVQLARDGSVVFRVDCSAIHRDGRRSELRFRSDGQRVSPRHM